MYLLSYFLSPLAYISRNRSKGTCDIENNTNDMITMERIRHIHNVSKLVHFYESPNISELDKLQKFNEYNFDEYPGFFISKGGLYKTFDEFDFSMFFL